MKKFTLDEFIALAKDKYDFTVLDDFGEESNNAIWNYNFEEMDNMLENVFIVHETPKVEIEDNKCKDKTLYKIIILDFEMRTQILCFYLNIQRCS